MKTDHMLVLLEEMQSSLKRVLESHGVLRQEMHARFAALDQ